MTVVERGESEHTSGTNLIRYSHDSVLDLSNGYVDTTWAFEQFKLALAGRLQAQNTSPLLPAICYDYRPPAPGVTQVCCWSAESAERTTRIISRDSLQNDWLELCAVSP